MGELAALLIFSPKAALFVFIKRLWLCILSGHSCVYCMFLRVWLMRFAFLQLLLLLFLILACFLK
jgi:hypothetical protein